MPYIIFVFYWFPVPGGCWICRPSWVSVFFVPASALKNCLFQLHLLLCESQRVFVAVYSCVCVLLCMYVCAPLLARQSLFVLSDHTSCVTLLPRDPYFMKQRKKTQKENENERWCFCAVPCRSSFIRPESEQEIHHNRLNPPLHEHGFSSKVFSPVAFSVFFCLFVCLLFYSPSSIFHFKCVWWMKWPLCCCDLQAWPGSRCEKQDLLSWAHPQTSHYWFKPQVHYHSKERERERGERQKTNAGRWSDRGRYCNKMGHREKSDEALGLERMKRWGRKRLRIRDREGDRWKNCAEGGDMTGCGGKQMKIYRKKQKCINQEGKQNM